MSSTRSKDRGAAYLATLLLVACASAPALARDQGAEAWKAVAASGQVEARLAVDQPAWSRIARGDELQPATLVRTGHKSRATLTRNASLLILEPSSEVELPAEARPGMETSVVQNSGSVLYEVDSRANPHFEVVTPYLVAGVKGTSFLVTVNDDYAAVTVEHGLVAVTHPETGEVVEVRPGESLIRQRDGMEMELIDGSEQRREARKEARRLARVDRGTHGDVTPMRGRSVGSAGQPADTAAALAGVGAHHHGHGGDDPAGSGLDVAVGDIEFPDDDFDDDHACKRTALSQDCKDDDDNDTGGSSGGSGSIGVDDIVDINVIRPGGLPSTTAGPETAATSESLRRLLEEQGSLSRADEGYAQDAMQRRQDLRRKDPARNR